MRRKTNDCVDLILFEKQIKRLEDYTNNRTKIKFLCLKKDCGFVWKTNTNIIINQKSGCPKCARCAKLTNIDIDDRLEDRNIRRIGQYCGYENKIEFLCLKSECEHMWFATPHSVIGALKRGCPKCGKSEPLTNILVDNRLQFRQIKRLENIKNSSEKIQWQCLKCHYVWRTSPNTILNMGCGCPKCGNVARLTNETVDKVIATRNIERLNDVQNALTKIDWKCIVEKCGFVWSTTPHAIMSGTGCPMCKNKNEKIIFDILSAHRINFITQQNINKIITNESRKYKVDFFIPNKNVIIEYNGSQHYEPRCFGGMSIEKAQHNLSSQETRDEYVRNFCKHNNLLLIEIDGRIFYGKKLSQHIENIIVGGFRL